MYNRLCIALTLLFLAAGPSLAYAADATDTARIKVSLITDEADAVISILEKKAAGSVITDKDWDRLFNCRPYQRLKKREAAFNVPLSDSSFKAFVLSDTLYKRVNLFKATLKKMKNIDMEASGYCALAYLPEGAIIKAEIYPVIKPKHNSFVFETDSDPAIFFYLDPEKSSEKYANTISHELHHIGYAWSCGKGRQDGDTALPVNSVLSWISAFGEGFAMIAAAGGPDIDPHAASSPEERARWNRDVANFNDDLKTVEKFFFDILEKRISKSKENETGYSFFGIQGPWYTVGWQMSALIERTFGRQKLIECICNQKELLETYNKAAEKYNNSSKNKYALWSVKLIERIANNK
jgi:hypothetical protein